MTNATPHRFDDANPDTWGRCHNLNRTEIRTEIIVNAHDALVAALENAASNAQWIIDWRSDDVPIDVQKVLIDIREKADAALEATK